MPEGDTIHRAARTLARVLPGAAVREAGAHPRTGIRAGRLVGWNVTRVEARGKHLLISLAPPEHTPTDEPGTPGSAAAPSELVLHTHLRMTGSWHLYRRGEPWRKPERQATVWITTGDWSAVCFNAPVCELLRAADLATHPVLSRLGPDLTAPAPDLADVRRRLDAQGDRVIADVLLDQRVFAGVGNVYKSELCFLHGVHPLTPVAELNAVVRAGLVADAARLLAANAAADSSGRVTTGAHGPGRLFVYGRGGRPCRRCGTPIRTALLGDPARRTAWCPRCQPAPAGGC